MPRNFLSRAVNTARIVANLPLQRRVAWLPPAALQARADHAVRATVRYAVERVPYYRELFQKLGLRAADIAGAADLDRLPLLEKTAVRAAPERFLAEGLGDQAIRFITSGSTGQPTIIYHDRRSIVANIAQCEPEKVVIRELLAGRRPVRWLSIYGRASTVRHIWGVYREETLLPEATTGATADIALPFEEVVAIVNAHKPHVLAGGGSYLEFLFTTALARGIALHSPTLVAYSGDTMTAPGRELIERHYGAKVLSGYSSVEAFRIGFSCGVGGGYHLRPDLCDLKIVDRAGRRVGPGELGEVVISNLVNRATVLLNYRIGDVAALDDSPCPCGRTLPRLVDLQGRVEDIIYLADGTVVHPRQIWAVMARQPAVLRYQLVQHGPYRLTLRLITADRTAFDRCVAALVDELKALLGEVAVEAEYCETLEASAEGKFRAVLSHWRPATSQ